MQCWLGASTGHDGAARLPVRSVLSEAGQRGEAVGDELVLHDHDLAQPRRRRDLDGQQQSLSAEDGQRLDH